MLSMKRWRSLFRVIGIMSGVLGIVAIARKPKSTYCDKPEEQNPFEGRMVRFIRDENDPANADGIHGHLEEDQELLVGKRHKTNFYEDRIKRCFDLILSFMGLIGLSPLLLILSIAIYLDDPGPVLFTQKRMGRNKRYFKLHKFRTMKMSTPHDVPTHMLQDPQSYITRVGKLLRKMSLDELPQLWDIFIGNMSLVGPRPGLWNQDVLTAERDKYGANDVKPGLTGWAQINGRDELLLEDKARLDGEYCNNISIKMDITCLIATVVNVLKQNGIIEGGTGALTGYIGERYKEIEDKK